MEVVELVRRAGGTASWAELTSSATAHAVKKAVAEKEIIRVTRGHYCLASVEEHRLAARRRSAVLSHLSAASVHGWSVKWPAAKAWVTVPRNRHLSAADGADLVVSWRDLTPSERTAGITAPVRTVLDCAMKLPFDEGLTVADSALRAEDVTLTQLRDAARALRGIGAPQARAVVAAADSRAANPFESVLRAIALGVPGLELVPQLRITESGLFATVDLGDDRLSLVLEAEGFASHGTRAALVRDCRRYTELEVFGWHVLRFTWEEVMGQPAWVRWAIESWVRRETTGRLPESPPHRQARAG